MLLPTAGFSMRGVLASGKKNIAGVHGQWPSYMCWLLLVINIIINECPSARAV